MLFSRSERDRVTETDKIDRDKRVRKTDRVTQSEVE